mgnify:CR=1 FL=1
MLGDISHVDHIYIRTGYTDMRKQLSGLLDIIQYNFKLDPYGNAVFPFFAGEKQTGSKQFIMKEMVSDFCISDSKMDA